MPSFNMKVIEEKPLSHQPERHTLAESFIRATTVIMVFLTLLGAFWAGLFPIRSDNDSWWHIKGGQVIWEHMRSHGLSLPEFDPFTYTGANVEWVNHEWLSQLFFYFAYAIAGLQGAIFLKAFILMCTFGLLTFYMYRNGVGWKMSCLGSIIALLASVGTLSLRPIVFTYLFVVIFMHFILSLQLGEHTKKSIAGLIIGEIVWVNLHGGALIGILLVGFWWLSEVWFCLITWLKENPTAPSFKRLGTSSMVLAAVVLASLINPFTYDIHLLPSKVMNDPFLVGSIGELQPPNMHHYKPFELIVLGVFLLPMLRTGSIWVYEGLAIVFFGHQALNYSRHMPLFALVAVPPIMSAFAEERSTLIPPAKAQDGFWGWLSSKVKWALAHHLDVIIVFIVFSYTFGLRPGKIWFANLYHFNHYMSDGYIKDDYPTNAVNVIERFNIPGPMFNHDNFSGYLIWRLAPEKLRLFTDARFDMWGSQYAKEEIAVFQALNQPFGAYHQNGEWFRFERQDQLDYILNNPEVLEQYPEVKIWKESGKPYWQYVLDKYNANFIISYENEVIDRVLKSKFQGWFLVYDDMQQFARGGYVIYLRDKPENLPLIRELALDIHRPYIPAGQP